MSAGVMAPPLLPVGVATQLPGRYMLQPAICSSGSGVGELDLSATKMSTSRQSTSLNSAATVISSGSSLVWTPQQADSTFCRKVNS